MYKIMTVYHLYAGTSKPDSDGQGQQSWSRDSEISESPPHQDVCGPGSPAALPILPSLDLREAWILGSWKMDLRSP